MQYRVHRLKQAQSESYRWTAHTGGIAVVKSSHYQGEEGVVEAPSAYRAWKLLQDQKQGLRPGDLLEILDQDGQTASLLIGKYIGFEPATWFIPELRATEEPSSKRRDAPDNAVSLD